MNVKNMYLRSNYFQQPLKYRLLLHHVAEEQWSRRSSVSYTDMVLSGLVLSQP